MMNCIKRTGRVNEVFGTITAFRFGKRHFKYFTVINSKLEASKVAQLVLY